MSTGNRNECKRGIVVSDLHLFSLRSWGMTCLDSLRTDLDAIDHLVLNGDIFDFRWSTLPDHERTVEAALDWLRLLVKDLPKCQVHLILGNHDCLEVFQAGLTRLATDLPRFEWHPYALTLGEALFLHGDCANGRMDAGGLNQYRAIWRWDRQRGRLPAHAYRYVDRLGFSRLVHEWHFPRRRTLDRILYYLDQAHPGWRQQTRDCYFGHTHLPFSNVEHDGIIFHNTGSAIRSMNFNPIFFEIHHPDNADCLGCSD